MLPAKVFLPDPTSFPASVPMNRPSSDCQGGSGCWFWWHPLPPPSLFDFRSFPASGYFPMGWFLASSSQSIGASALASVLPVNSQGWFPLVWSSCSPRDSQESSPGPQFESINYVALSLLFCPTLTSVHDYRKNHSFGHMNLCQQSDVFYI